MAYFDFPVLLAGNNRLDAIVPQLPSQGIGVIGPIGQKALAAADPGKQYVDSLDVTMLAGRQVDGDRSSQEVGGEVDFRGPAAARDANRLILRLFLGAPSAERWALT